MELCALGPKEQGDGVMVATQREKLCHVDSLWSELRPVDTNKAHVAALQGGNGGDMPPSLLPVSTSAQRCGPYSIPAQEQEQQQSKGQGGKESYHREGELFLSKENKKKQRK